MKNRFLVVVLTLGIFQSASVLTFANAQTEDNSLIGEEQTPAASSVLNIVRAHLAEQIVGSLTQNDLAEINYYVRRNFKDDNFKTVNRLVRDLRDKRSKAGHASIEHMVLDNAEIIAVNQALYEFVVREYSLDDIAWKEFQHRKVYTAIAIFLLIEEMENEAHVRQSKQASLPGDEVWFQLGAFSHVQDLLNFSGSIDRTAYQAHRSDQSTARFASLTGHDSPLVVDNVASRVLDAPRFIRIADDKGDESGKAEDYDISGAIRRTADFVTGMAPGTFANDIEGSYNRIPDFDDNDIYELELISFHYNAIVDEAKTANITSAQPFPVTSPHNNLYEDVQFREQLRGMLTRLRNFFSRANRYRRIENANPDTVEIELDDLGEEEEFDQLELKDPSEPDNEIEGLEDDPDEDEELDELELKDSEEPDNEIEGLDDDTQDAEETESNEGFDAAPWYSDQSDSDEESEADPSRPLVGQYISTEEALTNFDVMTDVAEAIAMRGDSSADALDASANATDALLEGNGGDIGDAIDELSTEDSGREAAEAAAEREREEIEDRASEEDRDNERQER